MKEFLEAIIKNIKEDLWLMKCMAFNPLHEQREEWKKERAMIGIGNTYIMQKRLENILSSLERIEKYCLSEINGSFYEDFEKQYEGTDIEPSYNNETVYGYILGVWEFHPEPKLTDDIQGFIDRHASVSSALTEGLTKFFPSAKPHKANADGEMQEVSLAECQMGDSLEAGKLLSVIDPFNDAMKEIRQIAENRGNLGEILTLIKG